MRGRHTNPFSRNEILFPIGFLFNRGKPWQG
jgi:hypothetical protein